MSVSAMAMLSLAMQPTGTLPVGELFEAHSIVVRVCGAEACERSQRTRCHRLEIRASVLPCASGVTVGCGPQSVCR
jgi:hypothetical protein